MASTYSPSLRIELIGAGEQAGTWNTTTNTNLGTLIESAIAGYISVSVTSANQAFTALDGAPDQSRNAVIALTTTTTANFAVYAPPQEKQYIIWNTTAYTATIYNSTVLGNTTAAGLGVAIPAGKKFVVFTTGANFYVADANAAAFSGILPVANGGTGVSTSTGTGNTVLSTSPTLVTPALGTPSALVGTNITGTAAGLSIGGNAATVTTNANLTGAVTSVGNAASLGSFTSLQLLTALTDETGTGANVFATSPALVTPLLGTPTSGTLTNCTGLPVSTGVSGLGVGVATFLATPSSLNLAAALTDETGTGSAVFATSPSLVTPALGTPSALVGTNITGTASGLTAGNVTTNANLTGAVTSVGNATSLGSFTSLQLLTALTNETGTGSAVFATSPTLVTPILGTPTSGTLTNCTFPTLNQSTTGNAATATSATQITNAGGWSVTPSGTTLYFSYNSINVAKLDSSGNLTVKANVTAYGTV